LKSLASTVAAYNTVPIILVLVVVFDYPNPSSIM